MEARLIPTEVGDLRPGREFGESSGDAGEFGAVGLGGGGRFEEVIPDGPVTADAPIGRGHLLRERSRPDKQGIETGSCRSCWPDSGLWERSRPDKKGIETFVPAGTVSGARNNGQTPDGVRSNVSTAAVPPSFTNLPKLTK